MVKPLVLLDKYFLDMKAQTQATKRKTKRYIKVKARKVLRAKEITSKRKRKLGNEIKLQTMYRMRANKRICEKIVEVSYTKSKIIIIKNR